MPKVRDYDYDAAPASSDVISFTDVSTDTTKYTTFADIPGGGGGANLTWTASTRTIASDTGTDAVISVADGTNAGLMTAAHYTKLNTQTLPYAATVFRTATNTVAVDRDGVVLSNLTTSAANNVTVIQAAIDEAAGTATFGTLSGTLGHGGGGTVKFSDQLFEVSGYIDVKYGVSLEGSGSFDRNGLTPSNSPTTPPKGHSFQGTTFAPTSGLGTLDVNPGAGTVTRTPVFVLGRVAQDAEQVLTNPHGVRITGINIDMRRKDTAQGILLVDTQFVTISSCAIANARSTGGCAIEIYSTLSPDDGAHGNHIRDCMIAYCATGIKADGSGSTDSLVADCRIVQCDVNSITIGATGGGGGWQISGCHFTTGPSEMNAGSGTTEGHIYLSGAPCVITGNYFDTTAGWPIYADSPMAVITGNYFKISNTYTAAIYLTSTASKSVINSNTAQASATTKGLIKFANTASVDYRPTVMGNVLGTGFSVGSDASSAIVGIAIDSSDNAIAETNAAMTLARGTTNPYIFGNRIVQSQV